MFDQRIGRGSGSVARPESDTPAPGKRTRAEEVPGRAGPMDVHAAAARGAATPASSLPHGDRIQRLFGRHDISAIQAHTGGDAAASARDMGAQAYATGDHVVLGAGADLHTVAHEAAHVVQQRGGVQLAGGVGAAGDRHEQHADAVADLVVQGKSAEALLDEHAGTGARPPAVQHKLIGDKTATKHGTFGDLLAGLTDIDLVTGDDGLDLEVKFGELDAGTNGLTTVLADDKQINPHVAITANDAKAARYKILIQLNRKVFEHEGSDAVTGQLHETLIHEWELHGREHARNIQQARTGKEPQGRIDHVEMFNPAETGMDRQIARRIREEKNAAIQQQIFNAYMMDVFAHIYHVQYEFLMPKKSTGRYAPVDRLLEFLGKVMGFFQLWTPRIQELVEDDPFRVAASELTAFGVKHAQDYASVKNYAGPRTLPIYPRTEEWIAKIQALVGAPVPAHNVTLQLGYEMNRPDFKWALVYLHELADTKAIPAAAEIQMDRTDDKEAWKKAVLAPRMQILLGLGVDVAKLNQNLDLREPGADAEAYQTKPVELVVKPPSIQPPPASRQASGHESSREPGAPPSERSKPAGPTVAPSESPYREDFARGEIGIYHQDLLYAEFSPDIARQILGGARGPFTNKHGQQFTFLKRTGDCFYFDAPFLHSGGVPCESVCLDKVSRGELGIYHMGSVLRDFAPDIAKQILAGARGPFVNDLKQSITFIRKQAAGDSFFFDSPYLH